LPLLEERLSNPVTALELSHKEKRMSLTSSIEDFRPAFFFYLWVNSPATGFNSASNFLFITVLSQFVNTVPEQPSYFNEMEPYSQLFA
jgi:hypothetical protein